MNRSEKFWDNQAGHFTEDRETIDLTGNKDYNTLLKYLGSEDIVLDYGCATGIVSNAIADKAREIHAIDISPKMIDTAKRIAKERNLDNIHYSTASIYDDTFSTESFNLIYAFRVLHLVPDSRAVLHRVHSLLKPGGIFISVTTCLGPAKVLIGWILFLLRKIGVFLVPVQFFKLSRLQELMTEEGFAIEETEKMDDRVPTYCIVARKEG